MGMYANFWAITWQDDDTQVRRRIAKADRNIEASDIVYSITGANEEESAVYFNKEQAVAIADAISNIDCEIEWQSQQNSNISKSLRKAASDDSVHEICYEWTA